MPSAVAAIRLLLLTGRRKNEIVTLRWDDIDRTAGEIRIRDGKTGARRVPLTPAVERVLAGVERVDGNPWVITGRNPRDHLKNLDQVWLRLRDRAKLGDVRIHDALRPSKTFDPAARAQVKRDADALAEKFAGYFGARTEPAREAA